MMDRLGGSASIRPARVRNAGCVDMGFVGQADAACDLAGRQTVGFMLHQEPEHVQPGGLGECRESEDASIVMQGLDGNAEDSPIDGVRERPDNAAISNDAMLATTDDVGEFVTKRIEVRDRARDLGQVLAGDHVHRLT